MAGYIVGNIEITDPETYEEYRKLVPPLVEKFGGKYLVRGGPAEQMEGNNPPKRVVVLEFPSLDAAKQFYKWSQKSFWAASFETLAALAPQERGPSTGSGQGHQSPIP